VWLQRGLTTVRLDDTPSNRRLREAIIRLNPDIALIGDPWRYEPPAEPRKRWWRIGT